ncbi:SDR family NAD(P)-dependent oxidoreductase [Photobacterium sagamiensis]|uniref:SDR family NAD(P)-dependent oxidoreductase n=1 Tax=Photobacterium sagamiensis TaxID=2910241 RepID=UPI003D1039CA
MSSNNIKTATVAACFSVTAQEIIKQLIESGAQVVGYGRAGDEQRARDLESQYNGKLTVLLGELTDEKACHELVAKSLDILGGTIDAHYHCSGVFSWSTWEEVEAKEMERLFSANFTTAWVLGREIFSAMKQRQTGSIMYVSARDTIRNIPYGFGPYMASKLALNGLVESLAAEGVQYGIKVNAVLPTIMDTDVNREAMPDVDHNDWVNPSQFASIMIDLTQPKKTNLSGSLIPVQGKML